MNNSDTHFALRYIHFNFDFVKMITTFPLQSNQVGTSIIESISGTHTTSSPPVSSSRDAPISVAKTPAVPTGKTDSQIRNSRPHNSSNRTTLLFVAITSILVLSWIPYWFTIFADTYVDLIVGRIFYVNNCTNFLVFAMNPTLRQEMAQVIKRLICCQRGRGWAGVHKEVTINATISHFGERYPSV